MSDTTVNKMTGFGVGSKYIGAHPMGLLIEADRPKTVTNPHAEENKDKVAPGNVFVETTNKRYFMYGAFFLIGLYILMK